MTEHQWTKSTLGHGDVMCAKCLITNREAAVLGTLNDCPHPSHTKPTLNPPNGGTRLAAELEEAKRLLGRFADASRSYAGSDYAGDDYCDEMQTIKVGDLRAAARFLY